jgi:hypothetical protein
VVRPLARARDRGAGRHRPWAHRLRRHSRPPGRPSRRPLSVGDISRVRPGIRSSMTFKLSFGYFSSREVIVSGHPSRYRPLPSLGRLGGSIRRPPLREGGPRQPSPGLTAGDINADEVRAGPSYFNGGPYSPTFSPPSSGPRKHLRKSGLPRLERACAALGGVLRSCPSSTHGAGGRADGLACRRPSGPPTGWLNPIQGRGDARRYGSGAFRPASRLLPDALRAGPAATRAHVGLRHCWGAAVSARKVWLSRLLSRGK